LDAVKIYHQWREESVGGWRHRRAPMTDEEALAYAEVRLRLERSLAVVQKLVTGVVERLTTCASLLPHSTRYLTRAIYETVLAGGESREAALKAASAAVLAQFLCPAVDDPVMCDIANASDINASIRQALELSSVILNPNRKLPPELAVLKSFASDARDVLIHDVVAMCITSDAQDDEPEMAWQDSGLWSSLTSSEVQLSFDEMCDVHGLIVENLRFLAREKADPLREQLKTVGRDPSVCSFLPERKRRSSDKIFGRSDEFIGDVEIKLRLALDEDHDIDASAGEASRAEHLFRKTKSMLAPLLAVTSDSTLWGALTSSTSEAQRRSYARYLRRKREVLRTYGGHYEDDGEGDLAFDDLKRQLLKNVTLLKHLGMVDEKNGFHDLIVALGEDVAEAKRYRTTRRLTIARLRQLVVLVSRRTELFEEEMLDIGETLDWWGERRRGTVALADAVAQPSKSQHQEKRVRFRKVR